MFQLFRNFILIILALSLVAGLIGYTQTKQTKIEEVSLSALVEKVNLKEVSVLSVSGNVIEARSAEENAQIFRAKKEYGQSITELLLDYGLTAEEIKTLNLEIKDESGTAFWLRAVLPYLLPILLLFGLMYFMSRQVQGANNRAMGFGQSTAREMKPDESKDKKTFADVAGAREAKEELKEVVEFLRDPKKFAAMGAKIPKGVLLMGSPGTGKTLLAKAVAGEAGVPFFHMSGSEFVEMFVGVGASRVRDLFAKAKKAAPAIVFIDEIDAVGRKRGAGLGGSHDEREQTLNQILVEMDGFDPNIGVIVVAATNRPDVLDSALLRPGRFDRRVVIDKPDIADREEILAVHAKGKPLNPNISIRRLAERTPGFTGADLANLLNEAAILAVRRNEKQIEETHILESVDKVIMGPEKRSRVMTDKEREMTAYHEAGHAIVGHFLPNCDPVRKVSIIGRGMAGGYTLSLPENDKRYETRANFVDDLAMMMGGYMAETIIYGQDMLSTGPSSDLKKATQLATSMAIRYGMIEELGPRVYGENEEMIFLAQEIHQKKNYSEATAEKIDAAINKLLEKAKETAGLIIREKRSEMDKLVKALLQKETIEQEEFVALLGPTTKKGTV